MKMRGVLYDGITARPQRIELTAMPEGLAVVGDGVTQVLDWDRLRRDGPLGLRDSGRPDWQITLDAPLPADVAAQLRRHGSLDRRAKVWIGTAAAVSLAVGVGLWFGGGWLLERGAPLVPHRVAGPIGRGFVVEMGHACTNLSGIAALAKLQARLTPAKGFAEPVTVTIVDAPVVNALALPGGEVVVFRKLIDEAASPDELAGVLAHEFAHVDRRHPNKALIRQMGLSLLARSIGGDAGGVVDLALLLQGSRRAEAEADTAAIPMLRNAGISPAPLAAFFDRQRLASAKSAGRAKDVLDAVGTYAATHPADADRASRFRAAELIGARPALDAADWQALRSVCKAT